MAFTEITEAYVNKDTETLKKDWDKEVQKEKEKLGRDLTKEEMVKFVAKYVIKHSLDDAYEARKFKEWKEEQNS